MKRCIGDGVCKIEAGFTHESSRETDEQGDKDSKLGAKVLHVSKGETRLLCTVDKAGDLVGSIMIIVAVGYDAGRYNVLTGMGKRMGVDIHDARLVYR
jgi:hypothetical protein